MPTTTPFLVEAIITITHTTQIIIKTIILKAAHKTARTLNTPILNHPLIQAQTQITNHNITLKIIILITTIPHPQIIIADIA